MRERAFCYFVLGASLSVLLRGLAQRRAGSLARPDTRRADTRREPAEVIDLAVWRELRGRRHAASR